MFTGIIREIGILKRSRRASRGVTIEIASRKLNPRPGDSVCVNGVCLTVTKKTPGGFLADVIPETLARSNLANLRAGAPVNLEPSLAYGSPLDGHLVSGHVETKSRVLAVSSAGRGAAITIELPKHLSPRIVEKGSVAINGVSLTVAAKTSSSFTAALTPYTLSHTNIGRLKKNGLVNIETDMMLRSAPANIAIIVSRFNEDITDQLLAGAKKALRESGIAEYSVHKVPGAFEIPWAAQKIAAQMSAPAGIIALGCVIQGESDHYRAVCDGVVYGLQKTALETGIPVMFGVLMCRTKKQARARAPLTDWKKNKGYECAKGLAELMTLWPSRHER